MPMAQEHTWEKRGSKDIKIVGLEDKHQVTTCVSSAANGTLLPMQIIFTGIFHLIYYSLVIMVQNLVLIL